MFKILTISLLSVLLQFGNQKNEKLPPLNLLLWDQASIFQIPIQPDPMIQKLTNQYLQALKNKGFSPDQQGIIIESDWVKFVEKNAKIPVSAASLTKIVTTIASLKTWGFNHHFDTLIYTNGNIENGILNGDLIIQGGGNPLYVWEEAIALGNKLNQIGIWQIKGNLLIFDNFKMNFQKNPQRSGEFLKEAFNKNLWKKEITKIFEVFPPKTPRPLVKINGNIKVINSLPINSRLILTQESLNLKEILRQMNLYSNNFIAQMLAEQIGKPQQMRDIVTSFAQIDPQEITLVNGSGLSGENKISPSAVCQMLLKLDHFLAKNNVTIEELFPISGKDRDGTAENRKFPQGISFKTGTLPSINVSALGGIIPTTNYGHVCFAILNNGINYLDARKQQDQFLNKIGQHWPIIPPSNQIKSQNQEQLGDITRVIINL